MTTETATFGAGCFWGVEAAFRKLNGVLETAVGYSGGTTVEPSYEDVCTGQTGHAEVIQVRFDSEVLTYEQLLEVFWNCHDATQVNRQGPDVGTQYRSAIFFHSREQEAAAVAAKELKQSKLADGKKIATTIESAGEFYRAEEYHQQYLEKRGMGSCHI